MDFRERVSLFLPYPDSYQVPFYHYLAKANISNSFNLRSQTLPFFIITFAFLWSQTDLLIPFEVWFAFFSSGLRWGQTQHILWLQPSFSMAENLATARLIPPFLSSSNVPLIPQNSLPRYLFLVPFSLSDLTCHLSDLRKLVLFSPRGELLPKLNWRVT